MSEKLIDRQDAPPAPAHPPVASPPPTDQRVSVLAADRACTRCYFNLAGQSIMRERHYGMLIVRCPECGTVASIQEYPLLGRWAGRWGAVAAGLWFFVATALTFVLAGIMFGFTMGTLEMTNEPLAKVIAARYEEHAKAEGTAVTGQNYMWWGIDVDWWSLQDKRELLAAAGGWVGAINWQGFAVWIVAFMVLFPLAGAWGVAAAHRRGIGLVVTLLPAVLIACVFFSISRLEPRVYGGGTHLAITVLWPVVAPVCLLLGCVSLTVGVLAGRPLARVMVRVLLPPRLRAPLAFLWTCDGRTARP